ncbi:hypothetical protein F966_00712 [Acinetobacter higginsii]|uniref:Uncharacterized protein n=1 Tax=Acinetobacter higginsii TaxID=70347 RepID=N8XTZ9_9GAMM|nr:hypothetical protein F966_00712 [Acinetobacter higginsii]
MTECQKMDVFFDLFKLCHYFFKDMDKSELIHNLFEPAYFLGGQHTDHGLF